MPEPGAGLRLAVAPDLAALEAAQERVADWLDGQGVGLATARRVRLVIEELLVNLVMHGRYPAGPEPALVELCLADGGVTLAIEDPAEPFDPREEPSPAAPPSLDDDRLGGLGLPLVRRMAEILHYGRTPNGWNRTELHFRVVSAGG
ncbi:ATP-binding protein [Falsiroseomonas sp. CW058]|uniref:ATP-binding protein n=1 Tax=Falsiroseomonas sp. CW058 TaxID=3388664 RepID=UPI003D31FBFF